MFVHGRAAGAFLLAATLSSCAATDSLDWTSNGPGNPGMSGPGVRESEHFAWSEAPRASVLFVVDNRASSCGLQSALRRGVPAFLDAIRTLVPDVELRIGVLASETAASGGDPRLHGALSTGPGLEPDHDDACGDFAHPDCGALLDENGRLAPIVTELTPSGALALACLMDVGTGEPADPFLAAAHALSPSRLAASGLVPPGSLLALVILSEDMDAGACADPVPGASVFECDLVARTPFDTAAMLERLARDIPGVTDLYIARLPVSGEDGEPGVPSAGGPILSPGEGGLSPVCSVPTPAPAPGDPMAGTMTSPDCVDTLGPTLYAVARDLASTLVPGCLEAPPCPGVGAGDISVEVGGTVGPGPLDPNEDYDLVRDPFCTGGYRVDFAIEPMVGDEVTIDYPAGSSISCGG